MIEVNLLPGAKRGKKSGGGAPSINFAAIGAAIAARVNDKWLAAAVVFGLVGGAALAGMFLIQRGQQASLEASLHDAVQDSTRYAALIRDRIQAEARRDSALVQLNIIRAIDGERFVWPHVMDEISRALPPYTWLRGVNNQVPQGVNPPAAVRLPPPDTTRGRRRRPTQVDFPRDTVRVRIVGRTADLQALTRFYRNLEDSPFLGSVQLQSSETGLESGKEIAQFTLDVTYTRPDSSLLRRAPFSAPQR